MSTEQLRWPSWCLLLLGIGLVGGQELLSTRPAESSLYLAYDIDGCQNAYNHRRPCNNSTYPECDCDSSGSGGSLIVQCCVGNKDFSAQYTPTTDLGPALTLYCPCDVNATVYKYLELLPIPSISRLELKQCPLPELGISQLFSGWTNVSSIHRLTLSSCSQVETFERGFFTNLPLLENLDVQSNGLTFLPEALFQESPNLKELWLNDNNLESIGKDLLHNLSQLTHLLLGSNRIQNLEEEAFKSLRKLRQLNLEHNNFSTLPPNVLQQLSNLTILDLSYNKISILDSDFFRHNLELEELALGSNAFQALPSGIFRNNKKLKKLSLQGNRHLSDLPGDTFANLTSLESLDLSDCNLTTLNPMLFANLSSLRLLKLGGNGLTSLPGNIFEGLKGLEELHLQGNQLNTLTPDFLKPLSNLEVIDLSENQLDFISKSSSSIGASMYGDQSPLQHNRKLKRINLSFNHIDRIFYDWGNFISLENIDLRNNTLSVLTIEDLSIFGNGLQLDLRYNQIRQINFDGVKESDSADSKRNTALRKTIYLDGNPLTCDCFTHNFVRYVNRSLQGVQHSWDVEASGLLCREPENLRGSSPLGLDPALFTCACQSEAINRSSCFCNMQPSSKTIVLDCQNPNATSIPPVDWQDYGIHIKATPDQMERLNDSAVGNAIIFLDLSSTGLSSFVFDSSWWKSIPEYFPGLKKLNLSHNSLTVVPQNVLKSWNATQGLALLLAGNPWECTCANQALLDLPNSLRIRIEDYDQMMCKVGEQLLSETSLTCDANSPIRNALVALPLLALILLVIFILLYRYRRVLRAWMYNRGICLSCVTEEDDEEDNGRIYDAFISFSHKDEDFVVHQLVPGLERPSNGEPAYRLCLHFRDWLAGEWIPDQISRSVSSSKRTIVVLSEHFLDSLWGKLEFRTAYQQLLSDKRMRLIIIIKGDLPPKENMDDELKTYLSLNTYLKWGDPWFWDRLRYALPHKGKKISSGSVRISQAIMEHGHTDGLGKEAKLNGAAKLNQLPPLPLLADRTNHRAHDILPPDIEMSLTPTSSASSTAPIFPTFTSQN